MEFFTELANNKILVISAMAWLTAGIIKVIVELFVEKKLDFKRVVGAGGMPSSHTATVVALCISTAYVCNVASPEFAIVFIFMIIVIHDAVGVRLETGKQAKVLNSMIFDTKLGEEIDMNKRLKEYIGHTPRQAFFGAVVGIVVSLIMLKFYQVI